VPPLTPMVGNAAPPLASCSTARTLAVALVTSRKSWDRALVVTLASSARRSFLTCSAVTPEEPMEVAPEVSTPTKVSSVSTATALLSSTANRSPATLLPNRASSSVTARIATTFTSSMVPEDNVSLLIGLACPCPTVVAVMPVELKPMRTRNGTFRVAGSMASKAPKDRSDARNALASVSYSASGSAQPLSTVVPADLPPSALPPGRGASRRRGDCPRRCS
jgi:hypothetical protein